MLKKNVMAIGLVMACAGCTNLNYNPTYLNLKRSAQTPVAQPKWFDHVLIIVLENGNKEDAEKTPFLKELKELAGQPESKHTELPLDVNAAYLSDFHGLFHPSYSNYLAMVSGSSLVESHFDLLHNLDLPTIADRLEDTHKWTWRNYAEDYPGAMDWCFREKHSYCAFYKRKHVPFLSFNSISEERRLKHIIPIDTVERKEIANISDRYVAEGQDSADKFWLDWKDDKPAYSFYSPNMIHDGHDSSLEVASNWLKGFIGKLPNDFWNDTLVIVTFDESDQKDEKNTNDIYTVFLGKVVVSKVAHEQYSHFNALRTIEENFGLATLGDQDAIAKPITGIWQKEFPIKPEHQ